MGRLTVRRGLSVVRRWIKSVDGCWVDFQRWRRQSSCFQAVVLFTSVCGLVCVLIVFHFSVVTAAQSDSLFARSMSSRPEGAAALLLDRGNESPTGPVLQHPSAKSSVLGIHGNALSSALRSENVTARLLSDDDILARPPKHQMTICAKVGNEAPYILEWLEFHRLQGVTNFELYIDDVLTSPQSLRAAQATRQMIQVYEEWLQRKTQAARKGKSKARKFVRPNIRVRSATSHLSTHFIDFPDPASGTNVHRISQHLALKNCYDDNAIDSEWIVNIDADEFFYAPKFDSVSDFFLSLYDDQKSNEADEVNEENGSNKADTAEENVSAIPSFAERYQAGAVGGVYMWPVSFGLSDRLLTPRLHSALDLQGGRATLQYGLISGRHVDGLLDKLENSKSLSAFDFFSSLLSKIPSLRSTADEAADHPVFSELDKLKNEDDSFFPLVIEEQTKRGMNIGHAGPDDIDKFLKFIIKEMPECGPYLQRLAGKPRLFKKTAEAAVATEFGPPPHPMCMPYNISPSLTNLGKSLTWTGRRWFPSRTRNARCHLNVGEGDESSSLSNATKTSTTQVCAPSEEEQSRVWDASKTVGDRRWRTIASEVYPLLYSESETRTNPLSSLSKKKVGLPPQKFAKRTTNLMHRYQTFVTPPNSGRGKNVRDPSGYGPTEVKVRKSRIPRKAELDRAEDRTRLCLVPWVHTCTHRVEAPYFIADNMKELRLDHHLFRSLESRTLTENSWRSADGWGKLGGLSLSPEIITSLKALELLNDESKLRFAPAIKQMYRELPTQVVHAQIYTPEPKSNAALTAKLIDYFDFFTCPSLSSLPAENADVPNFKSLSNGIKFNMCPKEFPYATHFMNDVPHPHSLLPRSWCHNATKVMNDIPKARPGLPAILYKKHPAFKRQLNRNVKPHEIAFCDPHQDAICCDYNDELAVKLRAVKPPTNFPFMDFREYNLESLRFSNQRK